MFTKNPYIDEYGTGVIMWMFETPPLKDLADLLCILEDGITEYTIPPEKLTPSRLRDPKLVSLIDDHYAPNPQQLVFNRGKFLNQWHQVMITSIKSCLGHGRVDLKDTLFTIVMDSKTLLPPIELFNVEADN
jgi:hypothetical protein